MQADSFERLDYEGKVLVLSPDVLKESIGMNAPCSGTPMTALGAVPTPLGAPFAVPAWAMESRPDGTAQDFTGVLKEEFLPAGPEKSWRSFKGRTQAWEGWK